LILARLEKAKFVGDEPVKTNTAEAFDVLL